LVLGFLATALAFAVDYYFGALHQPFLALWPGSSGELLGLSLLYSVAGAGLVGGLLALLSPLSGGLLLLATACGWFGLGASVPDGFSVNILVPLSLCLLGSVAGILAAGQPSPKPAVVAEGRVVTGLGRGVSLE